jgi:general stress protein 26
MLMQDVDDSGWLWFLTARGSRKAFELNQNPHASVAFQSLGGKRFVSVEGTAIVVRDSVDLKRMWNASYRSWFPKGRSDPSIALVALRVTRAEYWLVPRSRLGRITGGLKAQLTGGRQEADLHGVLVLEPLFD